MFHGAYFYIIFSYDVFIIFEVEGLHTSHNTKFFIAVFLPFPPYYHSHHNCKMSVHCFYVLGQIWLVIAKLLVIIERILIVL